MPKATSTKKSRASPYPRGTKKIVQGKCKMVVDKKDGVQDWEETRCPICMEHPHSAVLLRCSSYAKGCRPYVCNTSNRQSNCLIQFQKSSADSSSHSLPEDVQPIKGQQQPKLSCPLCRGQVNGWTVVEPARQFMNSKPRSCPFEECDYSGTYSELRNHIRGHHPMTNPSDVNPARQHEWQRLERETELKDMISVMLSELGDNATPALYDYLLSEFLMLATGSN
ncbi:hypothetical protein SLA2020_209590 [Shorea laevis]